MLTGNQTGILLLDYILQRLKAENKLPANGVVVKSFVSTGMAKLICNNYGVELVETPVGFKFIGEKIKEYEQTGEKEFIFGFEESCGYKFVKIDCNNLGFWLFSPVPRRGRGRGRS